MSSIVTLTETGNTNYPWETADVSHSSIQSEHRAHTTVWIANTDVSKVNTRRPSRSDSIRNELTDAVLTQPSSTQGRGHTVLWHGANGPLMTLKPEIAGWERLQKTKYRKDLRRVQVQETHLYKLSGRFLCFLGSRKAHRNYKDSKYI